MSEEQEKQNKIQSTPFMSPMYQYGSSILFLTNPENELFKLELILRGMKVDDNENLTQVSEPLLNNKGVSEVIGMTQSIVNQVTILSSLNKRDIQNLIDFFGDTLAKSMMVNRKSYGIINLSARDQIFFSTLTTAFICMKRAQDDTLSDKKFWRGSVQEIQQNITSQGQQKKGILSRLNPWNKG